MEYQVITGVDPFVVALYDQSRSRSFPLGGWKYDFGDEIIYGALPGERIDTGVSGNFTLPGDTQVFSRLSASTSGCLTGVGEVLNRPNFMNPMDPASYHTVERDAIHYTGVRFMCSEFDQEGSIDYKFDTGSGGRFECIAGESTSIRSQAFSSLPDDCNRINCGFDIDAGSDVAHIYKGAGVYLASLACSSLFGTTGWELSSSNFSGVGEELAYCLVKVYPTCPCIYVDVYGTASGGSKFITLTSDEFTCDDMSTFDACTGYQSAFSVSGFTGVSGYAPFLKVAASGRIVPRSLPITGSVWNWSDWYSDYTPGDRRNYGVIQTGWPTWRTQFGYDFSNPSVTAQSSHVYVMPGVYSVGLYPNFDVERISSVMGDIPWSYCVDDAMRNRQSVSADCVMLREIPPKGGAIAWTTPIDMTSYPTVVSGISVVGLSSGSFPIARMDWDFGDGSEIVSTSRYFSDTYSGIETEDTSGTWVDEIEDTNYWIGVSAGPYPERDPRKLTYNHRYVRTSVGEYPNGYVVSVTAFASNTDTSLVLTAALPPAALPVFSDIEGSIKIVDSKLEMDGNSLFMFESEKRGELYTVRTK